MAAGKCQLSGSSGLGHGFNATRAPTRVSARVSAFLPSAAAFPLLLARLTHRLLHPLLRGSAHTVTCHGLWDPLLRKRCAAASVLQHLLGLGRGFLLAGRRLGVRKEGKTWRRIFCSPSISRSRSPHRPSKSACGSCSSDRGDAREATAAGGAAAAEATGQPPSAPGRGAPGPDRAVQRPELLRLQDGAALPGPCPTGYLPREKFLSAAAQADDGLARTWGQHCWLLVRHRRALCLQVSLEQYLHLVGATLQWPGQLWCST